MKTCFKCEEEKSLSEFYAHPMMRDGHLGKCKACAKVDVQARYRATFEQRRAYERERNHRPERKAQKREYLRNRRRSDKVRARAWRAVNYAVSRGQLIPQPCEICGAKAEAHHPDYSKPLDVRWLCREHHRRIGHGQLAHVPETTVLME